MFNTCRNAFGCVFTERLYGWQPWSLLGPALSETTTSSPSLLPVKRIWTGKVGKQWLSEPLCNVKDLLLVPTHAKLTLLPEFGQLPLTPNTCSSLLEITLMNFSEFKVRKKKIKKIVLGLPKWNETFYTRHKVKLDVWHWEILCEDSLKILLRAPPAWVIPVPQN